MDAPDDLKSHVSSLITSGVSPLEIVVVSEHPEYHGELYFEVFEGQAAFATRYRDWVSAYSVLSELYNLTAFLTRLQTEGWQVVFDPGTKKILQDFQRWSEPVLVEGYTLHGFQQFSLNRARETDTWFFNWATGAGKALPLTEPVLTPSGWRTMGELVPGDFVIGSEGTAARVVSVHPQGVRSVHRIEFSDGTFVRCDAEHLWNVTKFPTARRRGPTPSSPSRRPRTREVVWKTLSTVEISSSMDDKRGWKLPALDGDVIFNEQIDLALDPYMLGVLLGDGHMSGVKGSVCTDREIIEQWGWPIYGRCGDYTITAGIPLGIREILKDLNVWGLLSDQKRIPDHYMTASPRDRLALLQGLLDTDGHAGRTGVEFSTTSPHLRDGVAELARGLRGKATVSKGRITKHPYHGEQIEGKISWRVFLAFPEDVVPFRLHRKRDSYTPPTQRKTPRKTIKRVFSEGVSEEQVCIVVDAPDSLFVTRGHALTHNSFTCAAGAKWLIDMGEIDQVIACTLPKSKIDMLRFFEYAGLDVVINDGDKARRGRGYAAQHQVYVANYEKLRVDYEQLLKLVSGRRVLWIFDECHKLISGDVDFNGIPKFNQARQSFEKLIRACGGGSKVWPMSASVVDGNPLRFRDVFSLGKGVRNPLGLRSEFEQHYADEIKTFDVKTGKKRRDGTDKTFPLVHHDWNLIRLQDVRHRVGDRTQTARKTDPGLVHLFKGLQTIVEPVQPSREEHAIFQAIIDLAWDAYQRHENLGPYYSCLRIAANTPAALLHTTHDFAADIAKDFNLAEKPPMSSKLEKLNEKLESIRESGDQVLVFTHWTNLSLHIIKDFLTVPSVAHWGTGQSDKESQRAKDEFTSNSDITCFLTSDAGAHGMNAQNARYVIQLEPTYSYDLSMQRASRIDRSDSHLDGLTNYVMLTDESVETRVWDIQNARRIVSGVTQGTNEVHSYSPQDLARAKQPEHSNLPFLIFGDRM